MRTNISDDVSTKSLLDPKLLYRLQLRGIETHENLSGQYEILPGIARVD